MQQIKQVLNKKNRISPPVIQTPFIKIEIESVNKQIKNDMAKSLGDLPNLKVVAVLKLIGNKRDKSKGVEYAVKKLDDLEMDT